MYFPAAQIVHAEPASLYLPAPQIMSQSDTPVDEAPEVLFPSLQLSQEGDETLLWYFPMGHAVQRTEDDPLYLPALQLVQAEDSMPVAALVRYLPAAQSEQEAEADPLYSPAAQLEQDVEADPLYLPVLQLEQTEDSSPVAPLLMCFPAGQLQMERSHNISGGCVS